jgi:quinol monooxygenase YgiN
MKNNSGVGLAIFAVGVTVGSLLCLLGVRLTAAPDRRSLEPSAFFLGVTVMFPNNELKAKFETEFKMLAEYVRKSEPLTFTFELLQSDKEPMQMFVLERYQDKSAYLDIHKKSNQFIMFRENFQRMIEEGVVINGHSYLETGIGFV